MPPSSVTTPSFPRFDAIRVLVDGAIAAECDNPTQFLPCTSAYDQIRGALLPDGWEASQAAGVGTTDEAFYDLGLVTTEATYANILLDTPLEPYFSVAHTLRDALRQSHNIPPLSPDSPRWQEAARVALTQVQDRASRNEPFLPTLHKDTTFAQAVSYFLQQGINLPLVGDTINMSPEDKVRFSAAAYRPLMSMGDVAAMNVVETLLANRFDGDVHRLHLHPNPDAMGQKTERNIPFGYLYRIALKTLGRDKTTLAGSALTAKAVAACKNFAAVYNVEPFSVYETSFAPREGKSLEVLRDIVLFDELFAIPQCDPALAGRMVVNLFGDIDAEDKLGWSTSDALRLFETLLGMTQDFVKSRFFTRADLLQKLSGKVASNKVEKLVRSFTLGPVNVLYERPEHARSSEARECMLVEASKGRLWTPGHLFLGPAFYNRMVTLYFGALSNAGSLVGTAFERHAEAIVKARGIPSMRGDYGLKKGQREGDADLIIQIDGMIVLFELKKKHLRRETFGGNDLQLAIDLSQGLIHGVNQLARQELKLVSEGRITFQDGAILELKNRRILKVVLSVFDHGGLHEAVVVHNALRSLAGAKLEVDLSLTPERQKHLDEANVELKRLGQNYLAYKEATGGDDRTANGFFRNIRFVDIFFVERVLSGSATADEVVNALVTAGTMITGRRDAHFDFGFWHAPAAD